MEVRAERQRRHHNGERRGCLRGRPHVRQEGRRGVSGGSTTGGGAGPRDGGPALCPEQPCLGRRRVREGEGPRIRARLVRDHDRAVRLRDDLCRDRDGAFQPADHARRRRPDSSLGQRLVQHAGDEDEPRLGQPRLCLRRRHLELRQRTLGRDRTGEAGFTDDPLRAHGHRHGGRDPLGTTGGPADYPRGARSLDRGGRPRRRQDLDQRPLLRRPPHARRVQGQGEEFGPLRTEQRPQRLRHHRAKVGAD